jgi:Tfp pilus assembly protein PilN
MFTELTNLVPRSKIRKNRREYFVRIAIVSIVVLAVLVGMQFLLLIPSYIYERQMVDAENAQLSKLSATLLNSEGQNVQTRLSALHAKATYLGSLAKVQTASTALRAVLALPRTGITLSGLTFSPPKAGAPGTMQLSGTATTRETLRAYDAALAGLPFVKNADLPISAYAKASDISFAIALTLNPAPTP